MALLVSGQPVWVNPTSRPPIAPRGNMRRTSIFALTLLLGLVIATGPAQAHARKFNTRVSLSYDGSSFSGQVSSNNADCEPARQVTLFQRAVGGDVARGTTTTGADGSFSFALPGENGLFYAVVSAKNLPGGYNHSHSCNGARSRTVKAGSGGVLGAGQGRGGLGGVASAGDGSLPFTGTQGVISLTALAALLIAAGLVLVRRNRARSRVPSSTNRLM
jgi:LPXTG-motif cell wall-anchored protein